MRDLGKLIVAKGFKKLPKVQKIAQSGHTDLQCKLVKTRRGLNSSVHSSAPSSSIRRFEPLSSKCKNWGVLV